MPSIISLTLWTNPKVEMMSEVLNAELVRTSDITSLFEALAASIQRCVEGDLIWLLKSNSTSHFNAIPMDSHMG